MLKGHDLMRSGEMDEVLGERVGVGQGTPDTTPSRAAVGGRSRNSAAVTRQNRRGGGAGTIASRAALKDTAGRMTADREAHLTNERLLVRWHGPPVR